MAAAYPKKSHGDIRQNADSVSHAFSKWPILPYELGHIFHEIKTIYLLIRSTEQIRYVNVKANARVLTESFFSFQYKALVFTLLLTNHHSL